MTIVVDIICMQDIFVDTFILDNIKKKCFVSSKIGQPTASAYAQLAPVHEKAAPSYAKAAAAAYVQAEAANAQAESMYAQAVSAYAQAEAA